MGAGLSVYRGFTWGLGLVLPAAAALGRPGGTWRGALTGASEEGAASAGSVWVHAASLGEVGAARRWIEALVGSGVRPPLLLTTRTRTGLERARREMSDTVVARIAPLDLPQTVRGLMDAASPSRLDIVETEVWPNLILEARRAGVAIVFVSGAVSERTEKRLRTLGVAGPTLFGRGVFALAQDETAAARFRALGIPPSHVRVTGDLKADLPRPHAVPGEASRPLIVYGSFRPGEEDAALATAEALATVALPDRASRPLLVVAPRHDDGAAYGRRAFIDAGYDLVERGEAERAGESLEAWIARAAAWPGKRVALLTTRGELPRLYDHARAAVVGGTFARFGGHTPLEAAARGCPVLAGPHHQGITVPLEALVRGGGGAVVQGPGELGGVVVRWWCDGRFAERSSAALRAAEHLGGAARRGLEALDQWRLVP